MRTRGDCSRSSPRTKSPLSHPRYWIPSYSPCPPYRSLYLPYRLHTPTTSSWTSPIVSRNASWNELWNSDWQTVTHETKASLYWTYISVSVRGNYRSNERGRPTSREQHVPHLPAPPHSTLPQCPIPTSPDRSFIERIHCNRVDVESSARKRLRPGEDGTHDSAQGRMTADDDVYGIGQ